MKLLRFIILIASFLIFTLATVSADKPNVVSQTPVNTEKTEPNPEAKTTAAVNLNWYSINGGGASFGTATNLKLGYSVGQSVAGQGASGNTELGIGFWHGAVSCLAKPGDANGDTKILLSDIVYIINFLFKSGPAPSPFCRGDANGVGGIVLTDVVYIINFLFKLGPAPVKTGLCCL